MKKWDGTEVIPGKLDILDERRLSKVEEQIDSINGRLLPRFGGVFTCPKCDALVQKRFIDYDHSGDKVLAWVCDCGYRTKTKTKDAE